MYFNARILNTESATKFIAFVLFNFSLDLEKKLLSFDLLIPKLRIDATYNLKGNILLLPIVGSGNVAMSMKDVKSSVYTKISIRKKPEVCMAQTHSKLSRILPRFTREIQTIEIPFNRRSFISMR